MNEVLICQTVLLMILARTLECVGTQAGRHCAILPSSRPADMRHDSLSDVSKEEKLMKSTGQSGLLPTGPRYITLMMKYFLLPWHQQGQRGTLKICGAVQSPPLCRSVPLLKTTTPRSIRNALRSSPPVPQDTGGRGSGELDG